jgi:PAS domain S-box-containing protein
MENLYKTNEELVQELHDLNYKHNSTLELQKKELIHHAKRTKLLNSDLNLKKTKMLKLTHEHQVIMIELEMINEELTFQNKEKGKRAEELAIANIELAFQNDEKGKRAEELTIANIELAFQNQEKGKRAEELAIANIKLSFQNDEKEKRAEELAIANIELAFQNDEKEKRAEELAIANIELAFQNNEKEKRAEELAIANIELAFQNNEKEKRAEELAIANVVLAIKKEKLAIILEVTNSGTWEWNFHTGETIFNERWANIIGYTLEEISPVSIETWEKFAHPDDLKQSNKLLKKFFKGEIDNYECDTRMKHKNGDWVWIRDRGKINEWGADGKPLVMSGIHEDINDRKKIEIALLKSIKELEDYKFALDQSAIIAITDENGIIKSVNDNFCKISQFSREELVGNSHRIIASKFHSKAFFKEMWTTIKSGNVWRGLVKNKQKNQEYYWVDTTIVPFLDANKRPFQYLAIRFDVTEIINAEDKIIKAKELAEESNHLKSAFLANMSHEIRTPMNGILGFTNILKGPNLSNENQQEYIKIIDESGIRLLSIINDIIDISKIESKQMEVSVSETNINDQIEYIYNFFKLEVANKGILLDYKNGLAKNDAYIKTDSEKIYAVLINLVKNAIKFCDKGTIDFGYNLKTKNKSTTEKISELEFYVKDSGVGIPNDRQNAIFDRFIQADFSDKRAFQGAGLGLSISKAYVEMLGGKIWVKSKIGIGSTFYFTIPFVLGTKGGTVQLKIPEQTKSETEIKKLKIIIVEDDAISKLLIRMVVAPLSKEIINVNNGFQAIEACKNHPDVDLIMMDINMPGMSGYEATRKIRQFNKKVIIIAQTANALSSDRKEAIDSGCNDYISKPINKDLLIQLIQKYFA